jgi:hypothetical protein
VGEVGPDHPLREPGLVRLLDDCSVVAAAFEEVVE